MYERFGRVRSVSRCQPIIQTFTGKGQPIYSTGLCEHHSWRLSRTLWARPTVSEAAVRIPNGPMSSNRANVEACLMGPCEHLTRKPPRPLWAHPTISAETVHTLTRPILFIRPNVEALAMGPCEGLWQRAYALTGCHRSTTGPPVNLCSSGPNT
jgi:hypothetical protein